MAASAQSLRCLIIESVSGRDRQHFLYRNSGHARTHMENQHRKTRWICLLSGSHCPLNGGRGTRAPGSACTFPPPSGLPHTQAIAGTLGSAARLVEQQPLLNTGRVVDVRAGQHAHVLAALKLHAAHRALLLLHRRRRRRRGAHAARVQRSRRAACHRHAGRADFVSHRQPLASCAMASPSITISIPGRVQAPSQCKRRFPKHCALLTAAGLTCG